MASIRNEYFKIENGAVEVLRLIDTVRVNNRLPHALCLTGIDHELKNTIAMIIAQDLVCEKLDRFRMACGQCGSCLRLAKSQSEYLLIITPEKEQIKIADARRINDFLSFSTGGRPRFIVVHEAQSLNRQAGNAILKSVEEPGSNVYFIMLVSDEKNLMPTIRSRVQKIYIHETQKKQTNVLRYPEQEMNVIHKSIELFDRFISKQNFIQDVDWRDWFKEKDKALKTLRIWASLGKDFVTSDFTHEHPIEQNIEIKPSLGQLKLALEAFVLKFGQYHFLCFLQALSQIEIEVRRQIDPILSLEALQVRFVSHHGLGIETK